MSIATIKHEVQERIKDQSGEILYRALHKIENDELYDQKSPSFKELEEFLKAPDKKTSFGNVDMLEDDYFDDFYVADSALEKISVLAKLKTENRRLAVERRESRRNERKQRIKNK